MIQEIASGRVKFFTERLAFSTAAGWTHGDPCRHAHTSLALAQECMVGVGA
jgi:hypothetical protein